MRDCSAVALMLGMLARSPLPWAHGAGQSARPAHALSEQPGSTIRHRAATAAPTSSTSHRAPCSLLPRTCGGCPRRSRRSTRPRPRSCAFGPNGTLTTNVLGTGTQHRPACGTARCTFRAAATRRSARAASTTSPTAAARRCSGWSPTSSSRPASPACTARSSATTPTSTRCAARWRPAFGFSPDVEGVLSGLIYNRGLANEQGSAYQNHPVLFAAQQFAVGAARGRASVAEASRSAPGRTPTGAEPAGRRSSHLGSRP